MIYNLKFLALIISISSLFFSCRSSNGNHDQVENLDSAMIPIQGTNLFDLDSFQLNKIRVINNAFIEVLPMSFEETVLNFRKEKNPDKEIMIWLKMADTYTKYVLSRPELTLSEKQEIFTLILNRSMMDESDAIQNSNLSKISVTDALNILRNYQ